MDDYTQVEDYLCPECDWSLHIEKSVWEEFDNHQDILQYLQEKVSGHIKTHGVAKKNTSPSNNITDYSNTSYLTYTQDAKSLIILE